MNQTHTALNNKGETVFASNLTKNDRGQDYFCIECNQKKYYTHGNVMVPHFRNCSDSTCECTAESNLHKAIKRLIIDHFGNDICEEEYSSTNITDKINRRADVILHTEIPVVFEIQVSPISQEEVDSRTRDWQSVGCEVIWIPTFNNLSPIFRYDDWLKFNDNNISEFIENLNNYQNFYMVDSVGVAVKCSLDRFDESIYKSILNIETLKRQQLINEKRRKRRIPYDIEKKKLTKIIEKRLLKGKYIDVGKNYLGNSKTIFETIKEIDKSFRTMISRAPYIELKRQSNYDWAIIKKLKEYKVPPLICMDILHAVGTKKARRNPKYLLMKVLDIYTTIEKETFNEKNRKTEMKDHVLSNSALYDLTVKDIFNIPDKKTRFPSMFHNSKTGKNTALEGDWIICWRHNVSHNHLSSLAVMSGFANCKDAGWGHKTSGVGPSTVNFKDGETIYTLWKFAKESGLIPEDDRIPLVAYKYLTEECV